MTVQTYLKVYAQPKTKEENRHRRFRFLLSYQFDNDNQTDNTTLMLSKQIIIKVSAGAHRK